MSGEREFLELFESKARVAKKKFAPLLENLDGYKKSVAAVLMDNELSDLRKRKNPLMEAPTNMAGSVGGTGSGYGDWTDNATGFEVVALPMIRRLIPQLKAFDLFSVQPMTQPVGIAFAMRFYATHFDSATGTYQRATAATGATRTNGGTMPLGSDKDAELIWNYNFTELSGGAGFNKLFDSESAVGGNRLDTYTGETAIPARIKMEIVKDSLSPVTRKLAADWTYEAMQDMESVHGIDLQAELVGETARSISTEIDRELIGQAIFKANPAVSLWTGLDTDGTTIHKYGTGTYKIPGDILWGDLDGRWFAERMLGLKTRIDEMATQVGVANRRGRANWMICSHQLASAFTVLEERGFYKKVSDGPELAGGISKVGELSGIDVYTDPLFEEFITYIMTIKNGNHLMVDPSDYTTSVDLSNQLVANPTGYWFILGFKGESVLDTGIVYMPYVPLMLTGMVYDPQTFQPSVAMMTRYGLTGNMFGTENYYAVGRVATDDPGVDPLPF